MAGNVFESSQRRIAVVAGIAFLVMTVAAAFAYGFVLGKLVVPGNAVATANRIIASVMLFRAGIFSFLIVLACDVVVAWALFILLKPVNMHLSLLTALFRLIYAAILGTAVLSLATMLRYLGGSGYLRVIPAVQLRAQALLSFNSFLDAWAIGLVVFGLHLLLLGYLVFRSGYMPKIIGVLLIIGALGYLVQNSVAFLLPNYESVKATFDAVLGLPNAVGELSLAIWLLVKGWVGAK